MEDGGFQAFLLAASHYFDELAAFAHPKPYILWQVHMAPLMTFFLILRSPPADCEPGFGCCINRILGMGGPEFCEVLVLLRRRTRHAVRFRVCSAGEDSCGMSVCLFCLRCLVLC